MLRIAICDDMSEFLLSTKIQLEQWKDKPEELIIELFNNGDSLIEAHIANPYDIIFLDVLMLLLNGIETASEIRKHDRSVKIVFLTSTSAFAVDSYTVHADNYLLKPVAPDKLLLEDSFFKYHRSYIVNIYRIVTYMQKEIRMQSGFRIPVSRSCHAEFESAYLIYSSGKTDDLKKNKEKHFALLLILSDTSIHPNHNLYHSRVSRNPVPDL